jgi:hypothetical protein
LAGRQTANTAAYVDSIYLKGHGKEKPGRRLDLTRVESKEALRVMERT